MDLTQLLPMYFERSNAFETLWSFYLTVVLGLLAFSGAGKQTTIAVAVFLTIAFIVFAAATLKALTVVTRQRCQLQTLIGAVAKAPDEMAIATTIDSSKVRRVVAFHLLGDVLAIAGIWCFALKPIGLVP
jgi:hypothetical protein